MTQIAAATKTRAIAGRSTELQFTISEEMSLTSVADVFVKSGLFSDATSQAIAMVKILAGREMNMEPVQAMMELYVVHGRIGMYAEAMAAKVKGSAQYRYKVLEHTDDTCSIQFFERVDGEWDECGPPSNFTAAEARKAGTQNMGKYPRNMLFARAMSNGFRWYCPDLKIGSIYTPEELNEISAGGLHRPSTGAAEDLDDALDTEYSVVDDLPQKAPGTPPAASEPPMGENADTTENDDDDPAGADVPAKSDTADEGESQEGGDPGSVVPGESKSSSVEPPAAEAPPAPAQPPADAVTPYQEWLKKASVFKQQLGDELYQATLEPYVAEGSASKANAVPPSDVDDALAALAKALESKGGPSGKSLESVAEYKKPDLIAGIEQLEKQLQLDHAATIALRTKHGIPGAIGSATMEILRPYAAHLIDMMDGTQGGLEV